VKPTTARRTQAPKTKVDYCQGNKYRFAYTECNDDGSRWKVAVPPTNCRLRWTPPPERGLNCSFSCKAGQYLQLSTQRCRRCQAGTYSIGDGKRYADWSALPDGFSSYGQDSNDGPKSSFRMDSKCIKDGWTPRTSYIESAGTGCKSVLKYEVTDLKKAGSISFTARTNDEMAFFHVWVDDSKTCGNSYNEYNDRESQNKEVYASLNSSWTTLNLSLSEGHSKIYFVAAHFVQYGNNNDADHYTSNSDHSVMIKEIVVRGFSYSESCDPCEAGSFSRPGASSCEKCQANTYSLARSSRCINCRRDQFSAEGSSKCEQRKSCDEDDYHMYWEPCQHGKTRKNFKWNEPKTCSDTQRGAKKLPKPSKFFDCPPCNPGQFHNQSIGCSFCPRGTFNNLGKGACQKCPPSTEDAPGLFYKYWRHIPGPPMHLFCLAKPENGCKSERGWEMHEEYMSSGIGHSDDARQVLYLIIPGFTEHTSKLKVDFQIDCETDKCHFILQSIENGNVHTIQTWEGQQERLIYTHERNDINGVRFRFVFEKAFDDEKQTFLLQNSRVKIYSIEVTNVENGGTSECAACVVGHDRSCVSCEKGEYMDKKNKKCLKCPENTFIPIGEDPTNGMTACKACPANTVSEPGSTACHSDCKLLSLDEHVYDFSVLKGSHIVRGAKMFTTKGYPYYHSFNISICGDSTDLVQCSNNVTTGGPKEERRPIHASVCRSTMIPDQEDEISVQSINIGSRLTSVTEVIQKKDSNKNDSVDIDSSSMSAKKIKFVFHSNRVTERCENGSQSIVELVCDPSQKGKGHIQLGNDECKAETCDGCSYPVTWHTQLACPVCAESDYITITTSCEDGFKKTHYIWRTPRICQGGVTKPNDKKVECTIFEKKIVDFKIYILAFLILGLLLAIIVLCLCYRNRKLNYRYHRLIDEGQMRNGELPASEVCTLEEGEEDDEEVIMSRSKGGHQRILDKLKNFSNNKRQDFSEFETINLDAMNGGYEDSDEEL